MFRSLIANKVRLHEAAAKYKRIDVAALDIANPFQHTAYLDEFARVAKMRGYIVDLVKCYNRTIGIVERLDARIAPLTTFQLVLVRMCRNINDDMRNIAGSPAYHAKFLNETLEYYKQEAHKPYISPVLADLVVGDIAIIRAKMRDAGVISSEFA